MICILNYGLGNLTAFERCLQRAQLPYQIISSPYELQSASRIILPGVGSFDQTISVLQGKGLYDSLDLAVNRYQIPILGVCVGMQIMGCSSTEGSLSGYGWIDGHVDLLHIANSKHPLPHMGWNTVSTNSNPLFANLDNAEYYFLHSYGFRELAPLYQPVSVFYESEFVAAFSYKNINGVQFHPEKSHQAGQKLITNFLLNESLTL